MTSRKFKGLSSDSVTSERRIALPWSKESRSAKSSTSRNRTLDEVPNRSLLHDNKQKKKLDTVPQISRLRVWRQRRKVVYAERTKRRTRSLVGSSNDCRTKQTRERHNSRVLELTKHSRTPCRVLIDYKRQLVIREQTSARVKLEDSIGKLRYGMLYWPTFANSVVPSLHVELDLVPIASQGLQTHIGATG